jgi:hypothetical protein
MVTIAFKGSHFEREVILWGVRWYVAYPLSYRQIEEMMSAVWRCQPQHDVEAHGVTWRKDTERYGSAAYLLLLSRGSFRLRCAPDSGGIQSPPGWRHPGA